MRDHPDIQSQTVKAKQATYTVIKQLNKTCVNEPNDDGNRHIFESSTCR